MNKLELLVSVIILHLSFVIKAQDNTGNNGILWRNDLNWNEVKALAKQKGKNIFIDCYATWCGPCKLMDKQVYGNDSIKGYFNEKFVSVKLQMDTSSYDDETIKRWFASADQMKKKYGITSLPTLLFLSPDDTLLEMKSGYQTVKKLLATAQGMPVKIRLYKEMDAYKSGKRDYMVLVELSDFAQKVLRDKDLSNQIANDYKNGYLEKVCIDSLLTKKNIQFVFLNPNLIHSQDHLFQVFYQNSEKVDSVFGKPETIRFMNWLVTKEELMDNLIKDKKSISNGEPDWPRLENNIFIKYPKLDARKLVNDFQIIYYRYYDLNWAKWASYKNIRIKRTPPDYKDWTAVSLELNDGGAWDVFANCNERPVLKIALDWINLAIKLEGKRQAGIPNSGFLDTKANVLYKLGEIKNAINLEQEAIQAALKKGTNAGINQAKQYEQVVEQMKAGMPTYTKSGVVWGEKLMPVK